MHYNVEPTHLSQAEFFSIHTSEANLELRVVLLLIIKVSEQATALKSLNSEPVNSPLSTCECCWLSEHHPRLPGTRRGAPKLRPSGRSWTRCCTTAWLLHTSSHHNSDHQPRAEHSEVIPAHLQPEAYIKCVAFKPLSKRI